MKDFYSTVLTWTHRGSTWILIALTTCVALACAAYELEQIEATTLFSTYIEPIMYEPRFLLLLALLTFVALCAALPSANRVLTLNLTHRDFRINMLDVQRAYWLMHQADREGVFELKEQFDAVRERIDWALSQPELREIDQNLLVVAAQMSTKSKDLAEAFSQEKETRARAAIAQRLEDIVDFEARVHVAAQLEADIRGLLREIDMRETSARAQLALHMEVIEPLLDNVGYKLTLDEPENVVKLTKGFPEPGE